MSKDDEAVETARTDEQPVPIDDPRAAWEKSLPEDVLARLRALRNSKSAFWLGAPFRKEDVAVFALVLQYRFRDAKDVGVAYIDRVVDRQLNKARGLLTFNSLVLATANIIALPAGPRLWASLFALASCLFLLTMMHVQWGSIQTYENWSEDIADGVRVTALRAKQLTLSLVFSVLATVILGSSVLSGGGPSAASLSAPSPPADPDSRAIAEKAASRSGAAGQAGADGGAAGGTP